MNIVIDMDNTLTDEFGSATQPGVIEFLEALKKDGHVLILWTNSTKERAILILKEHQLQSYFTRFIFREDYDPQNIGLNKDIRKVQGDILIDDDPDEIKYVIDLNQKGILITPFRKGKTSDPHELDQIYKKIKSKKLFWLFNWNLR